MRNRFFDLSTALFTLLVLFIAPGCSDIPTAPVAEPGDSSEVTPTLGKMLVNTVIPWSVEYFVPCANDGAGEIVQTDGNVHFFETATIDDRGGIHATIHTQAMDITGVGLSTGDVYQANGLFREQANFFGEGAWEDTYVNSFTLIGPGKGNNYHLQVTFHLTLDANLQFVVEVEHVSVECR